MRNYTLMALALALLSCSGNDNDKNKDGSTNPNDVGNSDWPQCRQPPTFAAGCVLMEKPGYGLCTGCVNCGSAGTFACDPFTKDCRTFPNGCYPKTYVSCGYNKKSPDVASLCQKCYFDDARTTNCEHLDGGATPDFSSQKDLAQAH
jgi:hypothetical protein